MKSFILAAVYGAGLGNVLYFALQQAYTIRLHSITEYGRVIHEFDPYFNYRATEYLYQHGWKAFSHWFDYQSWYPLGRPVGTTIYPGMQVTSVAIKAFLLPEWSINDICCFVPAWFGVLATLATAMLAYECSVGTFTTASNTCSTSTSTSTTRQTKNKSPTPSSSALSSPQEFGSILNHIPLVAQVYQLIIRPMVQYFLQLLLQTTGSTWGLVPSTSFATYSTSTSTLNNSNWSAPALESAVVTALLMSMVPAHLMRSVAGGYDNESIAMFAMTFTFYCWCRSLRGATPSSSTAAQDMTSTISPILWGAVTGLAYFYMVAAWGGYVFVLNMIGVHASVLVALGRYSTKLHRAYTTFYIVGTCLATTVPVVGWTPLKSLEQMGPLIAFAVFQVLEYCEIQKRTKQLSQKQLWILRMQVFGVVALVAAIIGYGLAESGYFGPISSRVRGLFVKHTKTGNPLVDSVAEHQPANEKAYQQYLDVLVYTSPVGLGLVALLYFHDASSFLVVYAMFAYYFSAKMVRLILLTAPIASILSGIAIGHFITWGLSALLGERPSLEPLFQGETDTPTNTTSSSNGAGENGTLSTENDTTAMATAVVPTAKPNSKKHQKNSKDDELLVEAAPVNNNSTSSSSSTTSENLIVRAIRFSIFAFLVYNYKDEARSFYDRCHELSHMLSHPTIIQKGRTRSGETVVIDDYREAYWWLRDNTPEDSRVMAWWDYGYQIAGIANRTTIADGNTWNHEHIALLGRTLTSPLKEGHRIARHLADYVLLWTGGGGDDVAKSPHMRRIANSVYRFLCPNDPTCRMFGVDQTGRPTRPMEESLLYQLHSHNIVPGVEADKNRFKLVYETQRGKVRIYKILSVSKESRAWAANPANRLCDAPGSWFCPGQYPPALQKILSEKKDFAQLEDFNRRSKDGNIDKEYTQQYLDNLNNPDKGHRVAAADDSASAAAKKKKKKKNIQKLHQEDIDILNNPEAWDDNAATTAVWEVIHANNIAEYGALLMENPELAHIRSKDGRGPMWWAHEYGRVEFVKLLKKLGVREDLQDEKGMTPLALSTIQ